MPNLWIVNAGVSGLARAALLLGISILLTACGGGGGGGGFSKKNSSATTSAVSSATSSAASSSAPAVDGVLRAAAADSPYKNDLVACVKTVNYEPVKLCQLSVIPFIGQHKTAPTKADILAQTVVSHPWMATNFSLLLDQMPSDLLLLFRGVTAVVIDAKIRPSHYLSSTGAIYLDPADLWLTASERATIAKDEDYRSGYSNGLGFRSLWRYVQGTSYAYKYYSLDSTVSQRELREIVQPMAALLFHELAHANDFMPPAVVAQVDPHRTAAAAIDAMESSFTSDSLRVQSPLNSAMQFSLAQIMYRGIGASDAQKALTAEQVGLDFAIDGASDSYNYSSQYEDLAMLFEEMMMFYHFGVSREIAFTDAPPSADALCNSYVVRWGVRNRIGDATVKARAQLIASKVLGRNLGAAYFDNIPAPRKLTAGVDWCKNLTGSAPLLKGAAQKMSDQSVDQPMPARDLLPHH